MMFTPHALRYTFSSLGIRILHIMPQHLKRLLCNEIFLFFLAPFQVSRPSKRTTHYGEVVLQPLVYERMYSDVCETKEFFFFLLVKRDINHML